MAAISTLAKMYSGMPHDLLTEVVPTESEEMKKRIGFHYMQMGADNEDRASMVFIARAYDSGLNLEEGRKPSAKEALHWYERITEHDDSEGDSTEWGMDDPPYMLLARQAEIWLEGAPNEGLDKDPNYSGELYNKAAESAMASMKGKLANKYYMLAEEAFGQVEEEEE